jgi:hypothetical protein
MVDVYISQEPVSIKMMEAPSSSEMLIHTEHTTQCLWLRKQESSQAWLKDLKCDLYKDNVFFML